MVPKDGTVTRAALRLPKTRRPISRVQKAIGVLLVLATFVSAWLGFQPGSIWLWALVGAVLGLALNWYERLPIRGDADSPPTTGP